MRTIPILLLTVLIASATQAADLSRLSDETWQEFAYGVSLRPPKDATVIDDPPGDALVLFVQPDGTQMSLTIREAVNPMDINKLKAMAAQQLTMAFPSFLPMEDPEPLTDIMNFPAGRVYMAVPDEDKGDWVMGHTFMLLDDFLFLNLQMQTEAANFAEAHKTFDAVAHGIGLMDPEELDRLRTQQIDAGDAWLAKLDRPTMIKATPETQLFRIVKADKDTGFMKMTHGPAKQLGIPGHRVLVQAHMEHDGGTSDVMSEYFETDDGSSELWGTNITKRRDQPAALPYNEVPAGQTINLSETGTRGRRSVDGGEIDNRPGRVNAGRTIPVIDVRIETQTRIENRSWDVPNVAFLSQFQMMLIGPMLPRERTTMAFYCYSSEEKKLALMTLRIEPIVQGPHRGGYTVYRRPAPTIGEEVMIYNADGRLVEWRTGDGQTFKATTPDELKRIWDGRG